MTDEKTCACTAYGPDDDACTNEPGCDKDCAGDHPDVCCSCFDGCSE